MSASDTSQTAPGWVPLGLSRAKQRGRQRSQARERIHERVVHPIDTPRLMRDPLVRDHSPLKSTLTVARLLIVAALLHGLILVIFFTATRILGEGRDYQPPERLTVRIVEPEPPEPPPPPPEPEPEEEQAPPPPDPIDKPKPKPKPKEKPREQIVPPDPVEPPPEVPPDAPPPEPVRRVVGLDLSSTVQGGAGPAFATGSSRMGQTRRKAEDPKKAAKQPVSPVVNQVATRLPVGNQKLTRPKRLKEVKAVYPPLLREQGIEADVVVVVTIGADGKLKVRVIRPAKQKEFNDAAVAAALKDSWRPATRGDEPVQYTERKTYKFRINDQ